MHQTEIAIWQHGCDGKLRKQWKKFCLALELQQQDFNCISCIIAACEEDDVVIIFIFQKKCKLSQYIQGYFQKESS